MEKDADKKPVTPDDFRRSGGDDGDAHGKDPATTNNEPFEEGQLETENKEPESGEARKQENGEE